MRHLVKNREARMPEITIPRTGAHLQKLFEILIANPDGLQAADALKQLAALVQMTPHEAGLYRTCNQTATTLKTAETNLERSTVSGTAEASVTFEEAEKEA